CHSCGASFLLHRLPTARIGTIADGVCALRSSVITQKCKCTQPPESAADTFYRVILQVTKDAAALLVPQPSKSAAIAHDRQPLDRTQEELKLPLQNWGSNLEGIFH